MLGRLLFVLVFLIFGCSSAEDDTDASAADVSLARARQSPLPTGNGFGFGVYSPKDDAVTAFYAHPIRFARPDPEKPQGEGIETPSLIEHLAWKSSGAARSVSYLDESQVLVAKAERGTHTMFIPFGLNRSVLVSVFDGAARPCLEIKWAAGAQRPVPASIGGRSAATVRFGDTDDSVVLVPLTEGATQFAACIGGSTGWAVATVGRDEDPAAVVAEITAWQAGATPSELGPREAGELEGWRRPAPRGLSDPERLLWRQSETTLRMAQVREPNLPNRHTHGLILASLPAGEWFLPWARDMAYATVALARMGHVEEARAALDAYLDAQPVGLVGDLVRNVPYQISTVRYFGDGSEEADFTDGGGRNVELDSWGLALWAMGEYVAASGDTAWLDTPTYRGTAYENIAEYIVKPLLANLDPAPGPLADDTAKIVAKDTGCWEQNDLPPMHYAFSTILGIQGLRSFGALARAKGDSAASDSAAEAASSLERGFEAAFVRDGRIHGVVEDSPKNDVDGAVLEAIVLGVATDPNVIAGTLAKMPVLARASGGFRRVTGSTGYERHEFLFIDFSLARVYLKLGRPADAAALIDRIVGRSAADHDVIPEMYVSARDEEFPGGVGDPTGAIPMVGYGAGAYALFMMDRSAN